MNPSPMLQVQGLQKSFPSGLRRQSVLTAVDLSLQAGEVLVLLGSSGSGKSTLLNLLAGLEYPDSGEIRILGQSQQALGEHRRTLFRRRHIGIVFQFFNLIPSLTVMENLQLPLQLNGLPVDTGSLQGLLDRLGLERMGPLYPEQLSGGEQQRVAIARAMVHRPALLLADEPTGSLDNATAERVTDLLFEQVRARQQSMILVTHNESLSRHGDRVLRLYQGRLQTDLAADRAL